jgi:hypothetical protein
MSWGNKLLVAFLVFGAMIGYLVFRAVNTNFEMVEKDYYKKELRYQTVIDGNNLANTLASPIQIAETTDEIIVQIPGDLDSNRISGNIIFYCAYDKTKDRTFEIQLDSNGKQNFSKSIINPGNYTVKIDWLFNGKNYYSEKSLTVH